MEPQDTIRIERRFCGPPDSGNGGYVCGRLAQCVDGEAVTVRLRVPPPLERDLEVRRHKSGAQLYAGDVLVAEARAGTAAESPADNSPAFAEAESASAQYVGFERHAFPSCFVCGPDREPHDGLCIFPGPVEAGARVAAPWIPDPSLAAAEGTVRPEFLWAALDCPGAFSFQIPVDRAVVLGELQVSVLGDVRAGERCVLTGQQLDEDGRKHHTLTALYGESSHCRGYGRATWIEVPADFRPPAA